MFRGCGQNLEDMGKVGGHEDTFSSCFSILSSSEAVVRICWRWPRLEVMRTYVNLIQYIFLVQKLWSGSEECSQGWRHKDIFLSCSVYFSVQRLRLQSRGNGHGHGHEENLFIKFNLI